MRLEKMKAMASLTKSIFLITSLLYLITFCDPVYSQGTTALRQQAALTRGSLEHSLPQRDVVARALDGGNAFSRRLLLRRSAASAPLAMLAKLLVPAPIAYVISCAPPIQDMIDAPPDGTHDGTQGHVEYKPITKEWIDDDGEPVTHVLRGSYRIEWIPKTGLRVLHYQVLEVLASSPEEANARFRDAIEAIEGEDEEGNPLPWPDFARFWEPVARGNNPRERHMEFLNVPIIPGQNRYYKIRPVLSDERPGQWTPVVEVKLSDVPLPPSAVSDLQSVILEEHLPAQVSLEWNSGDIPAGLGAYVVYIPRASNDEAAFIKMLEILGKFLNQEGLEPEERTFLEQEVRVYDTRGTTYTPLPFNPVEKNGIHSAVVVVRDVNDYPSEIRETSFEVDLPAAPSAPREMSVTPDGANVKLRWKVPRSVPAGELDSYRAIQVIGETIEETERIIRIAITPALERTQEEQEEYDHADSEGRIIFHYGLDPAPDEHGNVRTTIQDVPDGPSSFAVDGMDPNGRFSPASEIESVVVDAAAPGMLSGMRVGDRPGYEGLPAIVRVHCNVPTSQYPIAHYTFFLSRNKELLTNYRERLETGNWADWTAEQEREIITLESPGGQKNSFADAYDLEDGRPYYVFGFATAQNHRPGRPSLPVELFTVDTGDAERASAPQNISVTPHGLGVRATWPVPSSVPAGSVHSYTIIHTSGEDARELNLIAALAEDERTPEQQAQFSRAYAEERVIYRTGNNPTPDTGGNVTAGVYYKVPLGKNAFSVYAVDSNGRFGAISDVATITLKGTSAAASQTATQRAILTNI